MCMYMHVYACICVHTLYVKLFISILSLLLKTRSVAKIMFLWWKRNEQNDTDRRTLRYQDKNLSQCHCPPQIPCTLIRDRNQISAVRGLGLQLTAQTMAWSPDHVMRLSKVLWYCAELRGWTVNSWHFEDSSLLGCYAQSSSKQPFDNC